uniref:Uncharacterized protein n=1 Tax=Anguilla anguilla TaxID=7936 RepID=A0A0E9T821_ANGAN
MFLGNNWILTRTKASFTCVKYK